MEQLNLKDVTQYVEENIGAFHQKRIAGLKDLKLKKVLGKKNPYLFKAKYVLTAQDIIKSFTDALYLHKKKQFLVTGSRDLQYLLMEKFIRAENQEFQVLILEFDKDNIRYIVTIKSGTKLG